MDIHHRIVISCLVAFSFLAPNCQAQDITVSGTDWNVNIPPLSEAGKDYSGTYTSLSNQILLTVSLPLLLGGARVSAHYEPDPNWHNDLKIAIKRTGSGSGLCVLCSISGNENYLILGTSDLSLFTINATISLLTISNIPMQLRLSGVSVSVPAANYKSRVVFTISGN